MKRTKTMPNEEKNYACIDLVKLIMAVLVIGCHTDPLYGCENPFLADALHSLMQTAVPFFFLCTGFFLWKKIGNASFEDRQIELRRNLIKNIKLYVIWSVIYAPLAVLFFYSSGYSLERAIVSYLRGFFLMGQNYNSWMLWYLLACIYALLFLRFLLKRNASLARISVWGGMFYLFGLLLTEFITNSGPLPASIESVRYLLSRSIESGRIFSGFFFLPVGMQLADNKPAPGTGLVLFLCGFIGDILLAGVLGSLFRGISAVGIFLTVFGIHLQSRPLYPILRQMSIILYFIHMYVWTFYYTLVYGQKTFGMDSFLITTVVSLAFAHLFILFRRRRNNRP